MKLLFVCLGNICRSPAAEGIMNKILEQKNLQQKIICDSAGTSKHHRGYPADPRMKEAAKLKGYNITSISRSLDLKDFDLFNNIITMDESNYKDVISLAKSPEHKQKVLKMADFCHKNKCDFIPDPFYGEEEAFSEVVSLLEESCYNLLQYLLNKKNQKN